jgi:Plant transposon protein
VERVFAVLFKRFGILERPFRLWSRDDINDVVLCCVILHNIVLEDRRSCGEISGTRMELVSNELQTPISQLEEPSTDQEREKRAWDHANRVQNRDDHISLKGRLTEHIWNLRGKCIDLSDGDNF